MAHNLDTTTGRHAIAFMGDRNDIWHRHGQAMQAGQSIDDWSKAAGLDWQAIKVPALADLRALSATAWPRDFKESAGVARADGRHFVVRSDNGHILSPSTVSDVYQPVQPRAMLDWFQRYISVDDRFQLDVAGALKKGEIIWATATYRDAPKVAGEAHVMRMLMSTTFDLTASTINKGTTVRVVCNNTLDTALADGSKSVVKTRHNTKFDPARVGAELARIAGGFDAYKAMGDAMAMVEMSETDLKTFFRGVLEIPFDATAEDISKRKLNCYGELSSALTRTRGERNEPRGHASAWTALQAVTRWVDHEKTVRNGHGNPEEARLVASQFGSGSDTKDRAVALLTAMAPDLAGKTVETEDAFKLWLSNSKLKPALERV
jgi:phage/plasmid-like protein (TIGR03299 family)